HKYLEWQRRRQDRRDKNTQESVAIHPLTRFFCGASTVPVKICFAAFFRQQIKPDASSERSERCHRCVIRHSCGLLNAQLNNQNVGDEWKRKYGGIQKRYSEYSAAAHRGDEG